MPGSDSPLESVVLDDVAPETIPTDEIRAALESERSLVRQRGAHVCVALAEGDPAEIRPFVEALGAALHDDNAGVVQTAASALQSLVDDDASALADIVDDIALLTGAPLPDLRLAGAELLAGVARSRPADCAPVVGDLLDRLGEPRATADTDSFSAHAANRETKEAIQQRDREGREYGRRARQLLSNVVVAVAEERPAVVGDHVETLGELAATDDEIVRGAALDALHAGAQESPDTVRPVAETAVSALDADASVVRARAIRLLGVIGEEGYVEALEAVAATDEDDEIAAFAAETAAFLRA